ncbi:MAG: autotransporter outer membrane beta-barrel domain-containing protein [Micropepsaceae bacterium]
MKTTNRTDITMNRTRMMNLLGRTSTLTLAATAGLAGIGDANAACGGFDPGPLSSVNIIGPQSCVVINDPITNSVLVNADVGDSNDPSFLVETTTIGGRLQNNATIAAESHVALEIYYGSITDGITNTGVISSYGESPDAAVLLRMLSFVGGIVNEGEISGLVGIDGAEGITIEDGIVNGQDALIHGDETGIRLWNYDLSPELSGGISNSGTIEGGDFAIRIDMDSFQGGITNESDGVIRANSIGIEDTYVAILISETTGEFEGGLANDGLIDGNSGGFVFLGDTFNGDIVNTGTVQSQTGYGAIRVGGTTSFGGPITDTFAGNFSNSGLIDGGETWGVKIAAGLVSNGFDDISAFENGGEIHGGLSIHAALAGIDLTNTSQGLITSDHGTGLSIFAGGFFGSVQNDGTISGSTIGLSIASDPLFAGKSGPFALQQNQLVNANSIPLFFEGQVSNRGLIEGATTGLRVDVSTFYGTISNAGTIIADGVDELAIEEILANSYGSTGLMINPATELCTSECFTVYTSLSGKIQNSGLIQGGDGAYINLDELNAEGTGFSNSGTIIGTTGAGVSIDVDSWYGDIHNTGTIDGAYTGLIVNAGSFTGDIVNDGEITGGAFTTGLHVTATTFTGDIVNNDLLSAPGDALHLEIDYMDGDVVNTGTIIAESSYGTAALIEGLCTSGSFSGGFTNTGTIIAGDEGGEGYDSAGIVISNAEFAYGIVNDGGLIQASDAIDTSEASGGMIVLNTGSGIIRGDIHLNEFYGDDFIGEDGGVYGDIHGSGGEEGIYDDTFTVRNGTQFLVGEVQGFSTFTVEDGGTALLGTDTYGEDGDGFEGNEIQNFTVQGGGHAYLDDNAEVEADSITLDEGSELTFFLTTDEEQHGELKTTEGGSASLAGTVSVALDAASFAGTSQTDFEYDGVISGDTITGEFDNATVSGGSPFFELEVVYNGVTPANAVVIAEAEEPTVDLLLHRVSFASLGCSSSTQNNDAIGQMLEQAYINGDLTAEQLELYLALINSSDGCAAADAYDDLSGTPFDFIAFQLDGPFKKMVGARIDSGRSTGCIVAGDIGCFNRYAADTTAGSTVMTDAAPGEDPFAWLKTGVRRTGTSAVWGRGVGVWGESDGKPTAGAPGSRFNQKGAIIGADHAFSETFLAGVAGQFTDSDIKFPGHVDKVHVNSYEAGGYLSWGDTQGYLNGNFSYIWHNFDTSRLVLGSPVKGQFDGATVSAYLEMGKIFESDNWRLQPIVALSLASLSTEGYAEHGTSPNRLVVRDSGFDSLKSILGGRFAYPIELSSGRRMVPEARVSWSHELMDNSAQFDARLFSFPEIPASYFTTTGAKTERDAAILGAGLNAPVTDTAILYLDYDATLSTDQHAQTVSGGLRILW